MKIVPRAVVVTAAVVAMSAALAAAAPATAAQATVQDPVVVIDGTTIGLEQPPVEREGRVFVPLRGVFERLGARVVYTAGRIDASAGTHTIALRVGEATATVDGVTQPLDDPPLLIGGRTLVPLRFIAQALGATVKFDETTRIVSVTSLSRSQPSQPSPPPPPSPPPFEAVAAPPSVAASSPVAGMGGVPIVLRLLRLEPASDTTVPRKRPEISATFSETIDRSNTRISLDGRDVTAECYLSERSFVYDPSSDLSPGVHDVTIDGRTPARESFHEHWSFMTSDAANANYLSGLEPPSGATLSGARIEISGFTRPKARVRVIATTSETIPTFGGVPEGTSTTDAVANGKGFFSAMLPVVERGSGLLDVRVASTAPDGTVVVRTLRLRR